MVSSTGSTEQDRGHFVRPIRGFKPLFGQRKSRKHKGGVLRTLFARLVVVYAVVSPRKHTETARYRLT